MARQRTDDLNWLPRAITRGFLALLALGLLVAGWLIFQVNASGGISRNSFGDLRAAAKTQCEQYVLKSVRAPSSATFSPASQTDVRDAGVNGWVVDGYVDSQNAFGAMLRSNYHCALTSVGPDWELKDLTITAR